MEDLFPTSGGNFWIGRYQPTWITSRFSYPIPSLKSTGMFRLWPPDPANASPLLRTDPRSPPGTNSEQRGLCLCLWISSRQRLDTNLGVCWGLPGPKPGQAAMAAASACQPEAQHVMALPGLTIKFKRVCRYCRVSRPSESPGNICTHR